MYNLTLPLSIANSGKLIFLTLQNLRHRLTHRIYFQLAINSFDVVMHGIIPDTHFVRNHFVGYLITPINSHQYFILFHNHHLRPTNHITSLHGDKIYAQREWSTINLPGQF